MDAVLFSVWVGGQDRVAELRPTIFSFYNFIREINTMDSVSTFGRTLPLSTSSVPTSKYSMLIYSIFLAARARVVLLERLKCYKLNARLAPPL